ITVAARATLVMHSPGSPTMPDPNTIRKAVRHLKKVDPTMARLIAAVGPCRYEVRNFGTHFDALCRSIIYQQLSTKAAGTIHGRFLDLFADRRPDPERLLKIPEETLRGVGLSRQKLNYLRDLAARVH